jgi:protoporphyrinogen oxidase
MLLRPYAEKLFGISANLVDRRFFDTLVGATDASLPSRAKNWLEGRRVGPHESQLIIRPTRGIGVLADQLATVITGNGGAVRTSSAVERFLIGPSGVAGVELSSGEKRAHDHVISTLPLGLLIKKLPLVPVRAQQLTARLKVRACILIYARLSTRPIFPHQWIFFASPELALGRITDFANFGPHHRDTKGLLCGEVWCNSDDAIFADDDEALVARMRDELRRTGLLPANGRFTDFHVVKLRSAIPVLSVGFVEAVTQATGFLRAVGGLSTVGRHGAFGNESVQSSLLHGIDHAESLATTPTWNGGHLE